MSISKRSGVSWSTISKLSGVTKANVEKVSGVEAKLLLNDYTGATAAYSLRRLNANYTGNCIKVRNDSGTQLDIGFVGDYLDTASLSTHCGSGGGQITVWYDQSGNSRDASQSTVSAMPTIFSSGSLNEVNSKAAISFDGGDRLLTASTQLHTGAFYATCVVQSPSSIGNEQILGQDDSHSSPKVRVAQYLRTASSTSSGRVVVFNTSVANFADPSTSISTSNQVQISSYATSGGTIESFDDSATNGSSSYTGTLATTSMPASIGAGAGSAFVNAGFNGNIQEVVIWDGDKTSIRATIESDIDTYYSIT